eukprot:jgi/Psemu1/282127/fgenesh1_pg.3_\
MTELALQLQIQTQSCHEDIGRIGAELQAILPRCAADVGRVGVGLEGMRVDAQTLLDTTTPGGGELKDKDNNGSNNGSSLSGSLETLSTLHALQANLTQTKTVLTAAATWDSTISSVAPLLAEQNLTEAVHALAQLEAGETALRGMPNRDERKQSIAEIREQVQALLQPQLQHALQNMHTRLAPLQQCVALYSKLGKMDSLREDYVEAAQQAGEAFLAWLPTWYDTVLHLLTEERRQASTVFGATEAPEIVVRVLREAFRPILPSFQSRLEVVFSSATADSGSSSSSSAAAVRGSLETICSIYESTLRFLSLAYDLVAGTFLDLVESGAAKKGDTGLDLFKDMQGVFLQLASPFALYSQRFADLEARHSRVAAGMVSKDIQQTVGTVSSASMNLQTLQEATNRLKDLASFIFPIVDGSLDRFELLNGGYRVKDTLRSVDTILSNHLGELVIAVRSLSVSTTTDVQKFSSEFDEQHVLCAMEVLKMVGNFRRDMRNFVGGTRGRMKALCEQIEDHLAQEAALASSASSAFLMPESLSVLEIDSYLTKVFCGDNNSGNNNNNNIIISDEIDNDTNPSLVALRAVGEGTDSLYSDAEEAVQRLANSCHSFVFDVCSAVPKKHLNEIEQMSAWRETTSAADSLESYGTLPQQYITQVGEHMLSLVQTFEPFASDPPTLSLVNEAMDKVRDVALHPWTDFVSAAGYVGSEAAVRSLMSGNEIADLVLANAALTEEDAALEEGATDDEIASAAFCNAWLDVVGLGVTGRLLETMMRIPQLTPKGCDHLASDLNYLVNVFSALGVAGHPHPLVSHVAALAELSDDELEAQIQSRNTGSEIEGALRAVEARVALRRGISIG